MSDLPIDYADRLNMREQIARIDRNQAEVQKLLAEQLKLSAEAAKISVEQTKLSAEQSKLTAEAAKFRRERNLAPILAAAALGGFIAAVIPALLRGWGVQ